MLQESSTVAGRYRNPRRLVSIDHDALAASSYLAQQDGRTWSGWVRTLIQREVKACLGPWWRQRVHGNALDPRGLDEK